MNNVKMISNTLPPDYAMEQAQIARQQQMAQMLQQQAMAQTGEGRMVGKHYIAPSPIDQINKVMAAYLGQRGNRETDAAQAALAQRMGKDRSALLGQALQAREGVPEQPGAPLPQDVQGPVAPTPAVPGSNRKMAEILMGSQFPDLQQAGLNQLLKDPDKNVVVGRSLLNPQTGQVVGMDSTWQQEQEAARQQRLQDQQSMRSQRMDELKMRLEDQGLARADRAALQKEIAGMNISARQGMAEVANAMKQQKNVPKLPTSALKMQQEELDAIGTSGTINADLSALEKQIDDGKLKFGPVANFVAKGKNLAGISDEQTRNFASFMSTLEKQRNASLLLNKGTQTEGDANRAWNELISNVNDKGVVKQRLQEIQKINQRAVQLRKMNVDVIRSNFGVDPLDTEGYQNQPAAVGGSGLSADEASELEALRKRFAK